MKFKLNAISVFKLSLVTLSLFLAFIFVSSDADAKSKKRVAKISFEQCCTDNNNDTDKCQKMRNVRGKKEKKDKKWIAKACPKPVTREEASEEAAPEAVQDEAGEASESFDY